MRQRMWPFLVLVAIVAAVAASPAQAWKAPPRAELHANEGVDQLRPWSYSWSYPSGGEFCQHVHADGFPDYEPNLSVDTRHVTARVFFFRDQRPRVRRFRAYRHLDRFGRPRGDGRDVRSRVRPRRKDGEVVAWVVRFRTTVADERYFDLGVRFRSQRRCGQGGEASYSFGLRRD